MQGHTVMFLAVDGQAVGLLAVSDAIKESAHQALKELQAAGLRVQMLPARAKERGGAEALCSLAKPDARRCGHEPEFSVRHWQRPPLAPSDLAKSQIP